MADGEAGKQISRTNPEWRREFQETLPDLREDDIAGSGFAITGYSVHSALGGEAALARLRTRLSHRGLKLLLDFVPNHTGLDHPWVRNIPSITFPVAKSTWPGRRTTISGSSAKPATCCWRTGVIPISPVWPDTLQLNYGNPATQEAMIGELLKIAGQCDGVRCDMAMLVLPDVFERTWGLQPKPFWPEATQRVRKQFRTSCLWPRSIGICEWTYSSRDSTTLMINGFYDRLREGHAAPVRGHLCADPDYQRKMARFLENHDEPRAAGTFSVEMHRAAAVITFLSQGLRFFHQGQFEGRRKRISPHLVRAPSARDEVLRAFYDELLGVLQRQTVRDGQWQLLECAPGWEGNWTSDCFVVFAWQDSSQERLLVAVNYATTKVSAMSACLFLTSRATQFDSKISCPPPRTSTRVMISRHAAFTLTCQAGGITSFR